MYETNDNNTFNKRNGKSSNNRFIPFTIIFIIIIMSILLLNKREKLTLNVTNTNIAKFSITHIDENVIAKLKENNYGFSNNTAWDRFLNAKAMVVGDSTAEGLEAYQILDGVSVTWTRGRVIQYMEEDLTDAYSYKPNILILAYGANDLLSWNGNVDGYINAYDRVIRSIKEKFPNIKIGINEILPVSDNALSKNPEYGYREDFNKHLKEFCKKNDITFIENSSLLDNVKDGKKFESDGVHPKPFYYKLWANNMADVMGI